MKKRSKVALDETGKNYKNCENNKNLEILRGHWLTFPVPGTFISFRLKVHVVK